MHHVTKQKPIRSCLLRLAVNDNMKSQTNRRKMAGGELNACQAS